MSIFRRKKDESFDSAQDRDDDYDYDDEEERRLDRRVPSRKFKDLKPENRKKRKEPPKPWGKRERILVLSVFLTTILTSGVLALSAREYKLPGLPRLKFPTLDLQLFKEETIVIEGSKDQRTQLENLEKSKKATESFKEKTENLSGVYGLYVSRLEDGSSYGVNEKEIFEAASLIKLPVLATLYSEAENGNIDLDTKYSLKSSDKVSGSGSLSGKPAGTVLTYRQLAELMGQQSDNTAYGIIRRVVGDSDINEMIDEIGMHDTSLTDNETTPYDIGLFFEKLWKDQIVSEDSRYEILEFLTDTIYEDWIVAGIPDNIRVAHKYGREIHVVNDSGVVFAQDPFIIVIMSKGVLEKEADEIIPDLAKAIYDIENGN